MHIAVSSATDGTLMLLHWETSTKITVESHLGMLNICPAEGKVANTSPTLGDRVAKIRVANGDA